MSLTGLLCSAVSPGAYAYVCLPLRSFTDLHFYTSSGQVCLKVLLSITVWTGTDTYEWIWGFNNPEIIIRQSGRDFKVIWSVRNQ